ncbi:MAG TPA: BTAD domain-containing putative transcriptional regulator [Chthoniobacteraceae bacterium]
MIVELVMNIEAEFGIELPGGVAASLAVRGNMHEYIVRALRNRGKETDAAQVWERLTDIVVEQLGVRREEVTRSADLVRHLRAD